MNTVHDIREARDVEAQASEWLTLLASGDASAEDRTRFDAWLEAHPSHEEAFGQVIRTWDSLQLLGNRFRATTTGDIDPQLVADHFDVPKAMPRRRERPRWVAVAAMLVIAIGGTLFYSIDTSTRYRTEVGERTTVTLPDRSTIELNTDTEVRLGYTARARTVELRRGEAYFDVAHDRDRPFIVEAGRGTIRAIGTGFVVRVHDDAVRVTVTEGIVEILHDRTDIPSNALPTTVSTDPPAAASPAQVSEGQQVEYDQYLVAAAALAPDELDRELAWRQGLLIFEEHTLEDVIREVGRYTDVRLIIADDHLRDLRVGGAFQAGDLEAILEFVELGLGVTVNRETPETIYLTATPASNGEG